jgi:hypothetical protein
MDEIWKDIKGHEGLYQVSNLGRVKSLKREVFHRKGNLNIKERILKPHKSGLKNNIYYDVFLSNQVIKQIKIHRLVAETFLGNPDKKEQINHVDGNKLNNNVDNLEWVTAKENTVHAWENGLCSNIVNGSKLRRGEKSFTSKLTNDIVRNIRENKFGLTVKEFSALLDVSTSLIYKIKDYSIWKHITI